MNAFYAVSNIGELYVPVEYRDAVFARARVKVFAHQELRHLNRIFTHIRHGGVAVVEGQWDQITTVMDYIQRHKQDLIQEASHRNAKQRDRRDSRGKSASRALTEALARLMCWADADGILQVEPAPLLPYLLEFAGEPAAANQGKPFLLPLIKIQQIQSALAETYPIRALDASLVASENVLAPRSQETVECFQEALQYIRSHAPANNKVVDIGCGSGCLTLLARQELGDQTEVYASDLLPEAVATTQLNIQRLLPNSEGIAVMPAGDLFDPFTSRQFDVIIFNAPWVVARVRNRAELAIHDEKQETVKRFFAHVSNFLKPDGTILLGYADASGPKAIENLEAIIAAADFREAARFKRRVATHRSKRKWEQIRVSVLRRK
ncbi:class I SAM-dependent methyltransferase [Candidatus Poribacteria bacterium]|nr:class I SAM-dependent methyltransferase [Candidatus Poribacteria bacterium]MYG08700.1 class I SAM-dependent methyltransferase [Candidatus Poribacteria bacterium]MYK21465.1 class I SAM-dependent methyltransferase [Candidatus Poribacteria bacterium]